MMRWSDYFTGMCAAGTLRRLCCACGVLLAMVLAGCNSGSSSSGGGTSTALSVTVSPPAVIAQLNQSVQFAASVANAPNLAIAATNGAVRASNVVTITTTVAHGFVVGQGVTISGVTDVSFIGNFIIISVPTATTFTYVQAGSDASSGNGTVPHTAVTWQVNGTTGGNSTVGTITANGLYTAPGALVTSATATIAATGAVRASNVVTITTTAAHNFQNGQAVSISGVNAPPPLTATITATGAARVSNLVTITTTAAHGLAAGQSVIISGVTDSSFNGTFTVSSVPSTTTFTYGQIATDATSGGGTLSAPATPFNGIFLITSVPSTTTFTYAQTGSNSTSGGGTARSSTVQITAVSVASSTVTGTASVLLDSGITLSVAPATATMGTAQTLQFQITVTGTTNLGLDLNVNTFIGGNATVGTIAPSVCPLGTAADIVCATYTAPAAVPAPATVSIGVASQADPFKTASSTATILTATAATLTAIHPTLGAQGAIHEDIYITGTGFLSTTVVRFNGVVVPQVFTSATLLRVRVPGAGVLLGTAGVFPVDVQQQGGAPTAPINYTVMAVRPALVGPAPDSVTQSGAVTVSLHGGYFGTQAASAITAEFDGSAQSAQISPRQADFTFNAPATPGLYSVAARNASATPSLASYNLAVQPGALPIPSVLGPFPVGTTPSAVAINIATGIAVIANRGSNTVSLFALQGNTIGQPANTVFATIAVGTSPTGVAVDNLRNVAGVAVVANNGSNNISIVDLATATVTATIPSPTIPNSSPAAQFVPFAVGVNPLTGLALVANQSTNTATVIDLATNTVTGTVSSVGTGTNPQVDVEPRLNWAVITPGGSGPLSIVDMGRRTNVVTAVFGTGVRGVAINTESERALMTDPSSLNAQLFSVLDQTVTSVPLAETRLVAAAVNPLTDIGVVVNDTNNTASVVDLRARVRVGSAIAVGTKPVAVAIDPGSNKAVVVNETGGSVSVIDLGPLRPLHITQISTPVGSGPAPATTFTSAGPLTLTVIGFGFDNTSTVRLDETSVDVTTAFVSARQLTATVLAGRLGSARRYAVDVEKGLTHSNVSDLAVIHAVSVGAAGGSCPNGPLPKAVAIDEGRDLAVVTKSCTNDIAVIDMNTGAVTQTIAVGTSPEGVAIFSRRGRALVTNRGSDNVSIVDIDPASATAGTVLSTVAVGDEPLGVGVNEDTGVAVVANSNAASLSFFDSLATTPVSGTATTDLRPVAVAIEPGRDMAAVAHATSNTLTLVNMTSRTQLGRIPNLALPTGVTYDPVSDRFLVASSLANNLVIVHPDTLVALGARVGVNPTSIAYNYRSSSLVTVNTASNTLSVMDYQDQGGTTPAGSRIVRFVLNLAAGQQGAIAIHPRTNIAAVVDETGNRVLLVQLPR